MRLPTLGLPTLILILSGITHVTGRSSTGDRILVVLEDQIPKSEYTKFWASLTDRGYDLTFKTPRDESAHLVRYGERQFDHLIVFAPSAKSFAAPLTPQSILQAQFLGLNTLHLLSPNISELNRDTFREYDLEFVERDYLLLDPFSSLTPSDPSVILLPATSTLIPNGAILSPMTLTGSPIIYPGGTVHTSGSNPYLIDILHATKTGYVGENRVMDPEEIDADAGGSGKKDGVQSGKKGVLVSAMQTRDNARIGFVGSGRMFGDAYWGTMVQGGDGKTIETGNAGFAEDLTKWIFQETGVVKVVKSGHFRKDGVSKEMYRIKDDLTYTLTLSEHSTSPQNTSIWTPISLPDLQLDFTMLDPHIRTALSEVSSDETTTSYTAEFKAPDRHGVFKFVVEYWRPGYSYIRTSTTVSVVPFRHNEYPRFIVGAWPFYSSTMSTALAFLGFCAVWVWVGEGARGKKKAE